jgi:hypothetical protein
MTPLLVASCFLALLAPGDENSHEGCPHASALERRGDAGMGFDHAKTAHHFALTPDGGTIRVEALSAADVDSRDAIRMHLAHIAGAFSQGDFTLPMFIHETLPPGGATMRRLRNRIRYHAEDTERGARVVIETRDADALKAVHAFLRFQITEHHTGDVTRLRPSAR